MWLIAIFQCIGGRTCTFHFQMLKYQAENARKYWYMHPCHTEKCMHAHLNMHTCIFAYLHVWLHACTFEQADVYIEVLDAQWFLCIICTVVFNLQAQKSSESLIFVFGNMLKVQWIQVRCFMFSWLPYIKNWITSESQCMNN